MTLEAFLVGKALNGVDLLPDDRLINVVVNNGELFGVVVDDIPDYATLTRVAATVTDTTITTESGLTFDTTQYVMLGSPET